MAVELNHLIVRAKDKWASARFLAGILGIEAGPEWGRFAPVRVANGVTLDFADTVEPHPQHFAFLVGDAEFDAALARIRHAGVAFNANSHRDGCGEINQLYGGPIGLRYHLQHIAVQVRDACVGSPGLPSMSRRVDNTY